MEAGSGSDRTESTVGDAVYLSATASRLRGGKSLVASAVPAESSSSVRRPLRLAHVEATEAGSGSDRTGSTVGDAVYLSATASRLRGDRDGASG
jgi:hypothetical protein